MIWDARAAPSGCGKSAGAQPARCNICYIPYGPVSSGTGVLHPARPPCPWRLLIPSPVVHLRNCPWSSTNACPPQSRWTRRTLNSSPTRRGSSRAACAALSRRAARRGHCSRRSAAASLPPTATASQDGRSARAARLNVCLITVQSAGTDLSCLPLRGNRHVVPAGRERTAGHAPARRLRAESRSNSLAPRRPLHRGRAPSRSTMAEGHHHRTTAGRSSTTRAAPAI